MGYKSADIKGYYLQCEISAFKPSKMGEQEKIYTNQGVSSHQLAVGSHRLALHRIGIAVLKQVQCSLGAEEDVCSVKLKRLGKEKCKSKWGFVTDIVEIQQQSDCSMFVTRQIVTSKSLAFDDSFYFSCGNMQN